MSHVNIFISHRHTDSVAAMEMKRLLKGLCEKDKLQVFISEHIEGGQDWFKWIQERLVESNLLVLLYTDSSEDWDWCMYEAGLFTDLKGAEFRKVVCFHSTEQIPKPLRHLQGIKVDKSNIEQFLMDLYLGTELLKVDLPISPWLQDRQNEITDAAVELTKLLKRRKVETHYHGLHLFIDVHNADQIEEDKIPPESIVISDQQGIWDLFDLQASKWTWKDIEAEAKKNKDTAWLRELSEAMYRSRLRKRMNPIRSTYLSRTEMKNYRPILYRVDRRSDSSIQFKLLFIEDFSWQFVNVPEKIVTLVTALTMSTRFRHEILIPYTHRLKVNNSEEELQKSCDEIQKKINIIEEEALVRGLLNEERLRNVFQNPKEKEKMLKMYQEWYILRDSLSECIEDNRNEDVLAIMLKIGKLNDYFLNVGTRRLHEINSEIEKELTLKLSDEELIQ